MTEIQVGSRWANDANSDTIQRSVHCYIIILYYTKNVSIDKHTFIYTFQKTINHST